MAAEADDADAGDLTRELQDFGVAIGLHDKTMAYGDGLGN